MKVENHKKLQQALKRAADPVLMYSAAKNGMSLAQYLLFCGVSEEANPKKETDK